jgi:rod shape-determining protein MreD
MSLEELARLLRVLRLLLPGLVTYIAVMLTVMPLGIPFIAVVTPFLSLMAVYYWSIYRPDLLPPVAVFTLGILQDILTGGPVGLLALVLLLVQASAVSQRRILLGQAFSVEWAGLLLIAAGAGAVSWMLACAYYFALVPPIPFVVQALITAALYPLGSWLFNRVARLTIGAE